MIVKLLIEHHLEFLSLKGGCRASSESTLVKISNCWKSHDAAPLYFIPGMLDSGRHRNFPILPRNGYCSIPVKEILKNKGRPV